MLVFLKLKCEKFGLNICLKNFLVIFKLWIFMCVVVNVVIEIIVKSIKIKIIIILWILIFLESFL